MASRSEVVLAARSLLGTTYHEHARLRDVGVDCIGVPIVASWLTGLKPREFDIQGYSTTPDGSLLPQCDEHLIRIRRDEMQPGDVVVVRWGKEPHHVGVVGDWRHGGLSIIHAENYRHRKVIEHRLWFDGAMQFVAAYQIPGIE
jgi:cell wall-associated NlpC family hydrolase